ncbi:hypothetical protein Dimus_032287 [Dionaea muscipula]
MKNETNLRYLLVNDIKVARLGIVGAVSGVDLGVFIGRWRTEINESLSNLILKSKHSPAKYTISLVQKSQRERVSKRVCRRKSIRKRNQEESEKEYKKELQRTNDTKNYIKSL